MHRFGLVLPFLNAQSTQRLLCVCRSAKVELDDKRELALRSRFDKEFQEWDQNRMFGLDFWNAKVDADALCRFLVSPKARHLRRLRFRQFSNPANWIERLQLPSSLTDLSIEFGEGVPRGLGEFPKLKRLRLGRTLNLDLASLAPVFPNLVSLAMDSVTCENCNGEINGLDLLTTLRVENWRKRVPLSVLHLKVGLWGVHNGTDIATPSNIREISQTLVTLSCGFPWPGISSWPRLEKLQVNDIRGLKCWQMNHAPALHTFECELHSRIYADCTLPLRTLRIQASQLDMADAPAEIQSLCLKSFEPRRTSLSEFTGLRSLELHGMLFTERIIPRVVFESLEEFTFLNDGSDNQSASFRFLTRTPNLRRLALRFRYGGWFSKPIPMLPKLETIECDFFHASLFQPQVKHLTIPVSDHMLKNTTILEAIDQCRRLESLEIPLRPGLAALILEKLPLVVLKQTATLLPRND